jgi:hypothetical protein
MTFVSAEGLPELPAQRCSCLKGNYEPANYYTAHSSIVDGKILVSPVDRNGLGSPGYWSGST